MRREHAAPDKLAAKSPQFNSGKIAASGLAPLPAYPLKKSLKSIALWLFSALRSGAFPAPFRVLNDRQADGGLISSASGDCGKYWRNVSRRELFGICCGNMALRSLDMRRSHVGDLAGPVGLRRLASARGGAAKSLIYRIARRLRRLCRLFF